MADERLDDSQHADKADLPTPRTDALVESTSPGDKYGHMIGLARQLERELEAEKAERRYQLDKRKEAEHRCVQSAGTRTADDSPLAFNLPITEARIQHIVGERFNPASEEYRKARKAVWACLHEVSRGIKGSVQSATVSTNHQTGCGTFDEQGKCANCIKKISDLNDGRAFCPFGKYPAIDVPDSRSHK